MEIPKHGSWLMRAYRLVHQILVLERGPTDYRKSTIRSSDNQGQWGDRDAESDILSKK